MEKDEDLDLEKLPAKLKGGLKSMNQRQQLVCYQAAVGLKNKQIASLTGYTPQRVSDLLKMPVIKFTVEQMQWRIYGKDPKKRFEQMMPKAIKTVNSLLNKNTPASTRLSAAKEVFNRSMGMSTQKVELTNSYIKEIYENLDREVGGLKQSVIDVESKNANDDIEEVEIIENDRTPLEDELDVDSWIADNL